MDHDQRFKTLIRVFFAEFLRLFFSKWAERFDLSAVEWLDKEMLPNPPEGSRHLLDLVAKVHAKQPLGDSAVSGPNCSLVLVHLEVESADRTTELKPRLPAYYIHLRDRYQLSVLPIVIYLKVGLDGVGVDVHAEHVWELEVLRFSYLYVGLPGLDGLQYVKGDNFLGVALTALMQIPREQIVSLGAEAYRRLTEVPLTDQRRFLLKDCIDAYLPLSELQRQELDRLLQSPEMAEVQAMTKTTYDKGKEVGREEGSEKTLRSTLLRLGRKKFGPPSADIESRLGTNLDIPLLEELTERILDVQSWEELLSTAVKA